MFIRSISSPLHIFLLPSCSVQARIKAINTFFAKNGYRSVPNSSVYSQQGQSQYNSTHLYMQQVFSPQQQYPLYPLVPPTWNPSPAPYFQTPLVRPA